MNGTFDALRRLGLGLGEEALVALAARRIPQSRLFMVDLIPHLHRLFAAAPADARIRVVDVGMETGAGAPCSRSFTSLRATPTSRLR